MLLEALPPGGYGKCKMMSTGSALRRIGVAIIVLAVFASAKRSKAELKKLNEQCDTCGAIATSFFDAFDELKDSIEYAGSSKGWTKDNEKFLGKYDMSEALLHACLEKVCRQSDHKCNAMMEEAEEAIEDWFMSKPDTLSRDLLRNHLCVNEMSVCCPPHHYGASCKPCKSLDKSPSGTETVCSGRGKCSGDGYRTGSGKCSCNATYDGARCDTCAKGYYASSESATAEELVCLACDPACDDQGCTGAGPDACVACKQGYELVDARCEDVDECNAEESPCETGNYCVNTPGSHRCDACHAACVDGCSGPGADKCVACAEGYVHQDGTCVDKDECVLGEAECKVDEYCSNREGGADCLACNDACMPGEGCKGPDAKDCNACKQGWSHGDDGCTDIDECVGDQCAAGFNCENKPGSYECTCPKEKEEKDGQCVFDASKQALLDGASFHADNTTLSAVEEGENDDVVTASFAVGPSTGNTAIVTHTISDSNKHRLGNTPPVIHRVNTVEACCGDTFDVAVLKADADAVTLGVRRTDSRVGWAQDLKLQWHAKVPASAARDEL